MMAAAVLATGLCFAQQGPPPQPAQVAAEAANVKGVTGTIKEVKDKDKIVISVDKGKDRTISLADPKMKVDVAEGLAVGDKVKIIESGKKNSKTVQIVRDVAGGEQRSRSATDQK
jgi:hypothetical protein